MSATKDVNGVIQYVQRRDTWESDYSGVFVAQDFYLADATDVLKQMHFSTEVLPSNTSVTLFAPTVSGTIATEGGSTVIDWVGTWNATPTASLSGGQNGTVELRSDSGSTPTAVRCQAYNENSVALAIALTAVNNQRTVLSHLVPAGHYVRLVSSGNATISLVNQTEIVIG